MTKTIRPPVFRNDLKKLWITLIIIGLISSTFFVQIPQIEEYKIFINAGLGVVFLGLYSYWWIISSAHKLIIDDEKATWEQGIFNKFYIDVQLDEITSIKIKQSIYQRLMNIGDMALTSSGDNDEFVMMGMPYPHKIKKMLTQIEKKSD